ncbi:hypothetical protein JCM5353_006418 [Sporobolomyces roseus]
MSINRLALVELAISDLVGRISAGRIRNGSRPPPPTSYFPIISQNRTRIPRLSTSGATSPSKTLPQNLTSLHLESKFLPSLHLKRFWSRAKANQEYSLQFKVAVMGNQRSEERQEELESSNQSVAVSSPVHNSMPSTTNSTSLSSKSNSPTLLSDSDRTSSTEARTSLQKNTSADGEPEEVTITTAAAIAEVVKGIDRMCLEPKTADQLHEEVRCAHVPCLEEANRLLRELLGVLNVRMECKDRTVSLLEQQVDLLSNLNMAGIEMEKMKYREQEVRELREREKEWEARGVEWENWRRYSQEQIALRDERITMDKDKHGARVRVMEARIKYLQNELDKELSRS